MNSQALNRFCVSPWLWGFTLLPFLHVHFPSQKQTRTEINYMQIMTLE